MTNCDQAQFHGNPFRYCQCGWTEPPTRRHPNSVAARSLVTAFINYMLELHEITPEECGEITIHPGKNSKVTVFLRKENGKKFVLLTDEDCELARSLGATDAEIVCGDIATRVSEKEIYWDKDQIKAFQPE